MGINHRGAALVVLLIVTGCLQQHDPASPEAAIGSSPRQVAYSRLDLEDRALVDDDVLVFTGTGYVAAPRQSHPPDSRFDRFSPLAHMADWHCPYERDPEAEDRGTFFLYGTYNGDARRWVRRPLNFGSAAFILPPPESISVDPLESPYVLLGGWAPFGFDTAFDAGFGWQDPSAGISPSSGWFFLTNRFIDGASHFRARKYRLLNIEDPEDEVTVDLTIFIDRDDHLLATATATGSTRWVNPYIADNPHTPTSEALLRSPFTGRPVRTLTLGGYDEGLDENTGEGPLPVQYVPGFDHQGHDNVFSLQVDLGTPKNEDPVLGSYARGIGIYSLEMGSLDAVAGKPDTEPWDIQADNDITLFRTVCDHEHRDAYDVHDGNTASTEVSEALLIDIEIEKE